MKGICKMSLITGRSKCIRCTQDVQNEDMAGDYCIDCLNAMEREKGRAKQQLMAEICAECMGNCKPSQVTPVPWCEGGCDAINRAIILMEMEK